MLIDAPITPDHTAVMVGSCELEMVGLPGKAITLTTTDEGQRRGKKILFSCLIINFFFFYIGLMCHFPTLCHIYSRFN